MNNLPGAKEMLALLNALRVAVREFAQREEKLAGACKAAIAAENKDFAARTAAQSRSASEAFAVAEAAHQAGLTGRTTRFEKRKKWINQAHFSSRKRAMERIREKEDRARYKVQEGSFAAERRRDAGVVAATESFQESQARLESLRATFAQLERDARRVFLGYGKFRRMLKPKVSSEADSGLDDRQLLEGLEAARVRVEELLGKFRARIVTRLGGLFPVWLQLVLFAAGVAFVFLGPALGVLGTELVRHRVQIGFGGWVLLVLGRLVLQRRATPLAAALAGELVQSRHRRELCGQKIDHRFESEYVRVRQQHDDTTRRLDQDWKSAGKAALHMQDERPRQVDEQAPRVYQKNERLHGRLLDRIEADWAEARARLQRDADAAVRALDSAHGAALARLEETHAKQWHELEADWNRQIRPMYDTVRTGVTRAGEWFPEWRVEQWTDWQPPEGFLNAAKFGSLEVNTAAMFDATPKDPRLGLPGAPVFEVPLALAYPNAGSILFEGSGDGGAEALASINNIIFRLLSTTAPGKLSFTIFDPVGLGQNFAGLMHLADYEESHINSRIWTQSGQLEEKLGELNDHMEKVIQMYLRNEYATIAEYNAQAGTIAEKYHFLVIADFPVNVSDTAARRLINIATSGARCGVYTLIYWDRRHALPQGFVPEELRRNGLRLVRTDSGFEIAEQQPPGTRLRLDPPPEPEFATHFLREVGRSGKDTNRVEVPFKHVAPPESEVWSEETTEELQVPIGRSGATKLQYLEIGKGTRQHALVAGKTGSGKSTLFHVIITNLALWCSPEQVEFYLVDFKKGVEFKNYASRRLPHAKVVAIESDRQFGLSVLQRVDEELRRRGELFRELGVQDLPGYKRAGGKEPMPRSLLIIDEFQEFFVEEDRVSQYSAVLLDRIVRQGRAFGIHVLLGSQTLGGAYTLARATIGQMVIRIALQCNEADAYLIMDQDNPAPRLLSRPGEGIYNNSAGSIEGNSPFQTVWLPEQERDEFLVKIRERADREPNPAPGPFVFEGNAPADVRENALLRDALGSTPSERPSQARVWFGAPNSIKGPTETAFQRQSGSNVLVVGQSEERSFTLMCVALVALAAQYPRSGARFVLLDSTPPAFPHRENLRRILGAMPQDVVQATNSNAAEVLAGLVEELNQRTGDDRTVAPEIFLVIHGIQNFRKLKQEDDFSFSSSTADGGAAQASASLQTLLVEGPAKGLHVVTVCDTYGNVTRFLGRKTLAEFETRILFQMSASDSASLIDAPDASTLGLNRALLYNDREGYTETFRPYALPDTEWIETAVRGLERRKAVKRGAGDARRKA